MAGQGNGLSPRDQGETGGEPTVTLLPPAASRPPCRDHRLGASRTPLATCEVASVARGR
jgi:hypothetical protein